MIKSLKKNIKGILIEGLTLSSALLIIAIIVVMVTVIVVGGKDQISWEFLTSFPEDGMTKGGIFPAIYGTALLVIMMSVAAVPFGTITAIYLTEYAKEHSIIAKTIRFAVRTLAVIPSIIYGLFGLGFFIKFVGTTMDDTFLGGQLKWGQPNILWASLTMALLTLPVVIVSVEEALKTVPNDLRAASLALGATKWQTIYKVVVPSAKSGILASFILGMGRAIGETMAVIMIAGNALKIPTGILDPLRTLTGNIALELAYATGDHRLGLFSTGVVLLVIIMILNYIANFGIKRKVIK